MDINLSETAKSIIKKPHTPPVKGLDRTNQLTGVLKELRQLSGISQTEVANVLGLFRTSVTLMEQGKQTVKIEHIELLLSIYHCSLC